MEKSQSDEDKINKIKAIVTREIEKELISKQDEVMEITDKIEEVLRNLDILKYVVTVNYYENNPGLTSKKVVSHADENKEEKVQKQIHPCVKKLLPFHSNYVKSFGDGSHSYETRKSKKNSPVDAAQSSEVKDNYKECSVKNENITLNGVYESDDVKNEDDVTNIPLPQYIPPLPNPDLVKEVANSQRGGSSRVQHRAIIGNISKWIPPDTREDNSTHKWMVYIRNQEKDKDITQLIRKVRYFLHESYKPHDIIDVTSSPFHLTRRGWGEFPIRVQLHFHHPLNKPVDIIHNLKLDMTCSGVQTLGAETIVDLFLHQNSSDMGKTKTKKIETESEYVNGKKTTERGDVYDGDLLTPVNGINNVRVYVKEEPSSNIENNDENSVNSEKSDSLVVNNSNSTLDRRKLLEIIEREHDYVKCDKIVDEAVGESLLKLINSGSSENDAAYRNEAVLDAMKVNSRKGYDLEKIETSLSKGESEVFKTLKSVVSKLEGETQSKYCMKIFRHSYLVNIVQRVHATKLKTVESLIKWFFRRWPIITKLAMDQTYKHIHPYSCPSEEEFSQYNIGKQRSAEWFRAKAIQKILTSLKPTIPIEEEIWTTKQILMWSRFHGYSPASFAKAPADDPYPEDEFSSKRLRSNESSSESEDESEFSSKRGKSNSGKFVNGLNLIEKKKNFKRARKKSHPNDSPFQAKSYREVSSFSDANDVTRYGSLEYRSLRCKSSPEIDIVNVDEDETDVPELSSSVVNGKRSEACLTVVTAPPEEIHVNKFVTCAARQIGVRLPNEEILPGVMCDSAARVLSQTVVSFLDELLRKSLAQAWLRNGDRPPASLEYDDILATLLEHPQFDVFTNRGLGIQPVIKSEH